MSSDGYDSSVEHIRINHIWLITFSIVFGWTLWVLVNIPDYIAMSRSDLPKALLWDFVEQCVESVILAEMSLLYSKMVLKKFFSKQKTMKNLLLLVILLAALNSLLSVLAGGLYKIVYPNENHIFTVVVFTIYTNLSVLTTAYLVIFLTNRYRDEIKANVELEKQIMNKELVLLRSKLKILSLQTDNHFVFNSFSTLSNLIATSPDDAERFLQGVIQIYRYHIIEGAKVFILLKKELQMLEEFVRVLEYRFTGFEVDISHDLYDLNCYVCPISLSELVGNALKHNCHGSGEKLIINIFKDVDHIVVSNNILPREGEPDKPGTGLENLKARYLLLSDKDVIINNDGQWFEVRLPIVFEEDIKDESFNH